jgi:hypothetical protein
MPEWLPREMTRCCSGPPNSSKHEPELPSCVEVFDIVNESHEVKGLAVDLVIGV